MAALLATVLACGGSGPNVQATVDAVNTAVEETLTALTQSPAATAATPTAPLTVPATPIPSNTPDLSPPTPSDPAATAPATSPPAPTSTMGELARPNGVVVHAPRRDTPPVIDAHFDDWPTPLPYTIDQNVYGPENWAGPADQSASFGVAWDASYLYLLAVVTDDVHVQDSHGELLYRGDSLELQLDTDLAGDFAEIRLNADDFQLGLSPGNASNPTEVYLWNPVEHRGVPAGIQLASRLHASGGGYALEAAIPWSLYGVTPAPGNRFGFALNSSDNDTPGTAVQETMISYVATRRLLDPTTWGTLALDP